MVPSQENRTQMALICKDRFKATCLNEIYHVHGLTVSLSKHVVKRDKTIQVHI
jgi:hypothetical protein